jgi:hypothetical protein
MYGGDWPKLQLRSAGLSTEEPEEPVSALPVEDPRRSGQEVDDIGSGLDDLVVDGCGRCKLALSANLSLTQTLQAEDVSRVGMKWLAFGQHAAATAYRHRDEAALTCATLEYGA